MTQSSARIYGGSQRRTPRDIALDSTLSNARKIELLKTIKDYNAAPWQKSISREADLEMAKLLRTGGVGVRP